MTATKEERPRRVFWYCWLCNTDLDETEPPVCLVCGRCKECVEVPVGSTTCRECGGGQ